MIKIIKCINEEDINYQIKRQKEDNYEIMSIHPVIEPIGHIWIGYISNPHSNYDNVNFVKKYYECIFSKI